MQESMQESNPQQNSNIPDNTPEQPVTPPTATNAPVSPTPVTPASGTPLPNQQPAAPAAMEPQKKKHVVRNILIVVGILFGLFLTFVIVSPFIFQKPSKNIDGQSQTNQSNAGSVEVPADYKVINSNSFVVALPSNAQQTTGENKDLFSANFQAPYGTVYVDLYNEGSPALNPAPNSTYYGTVTELPTTISGVQTIIKEADYRESTPAKSDTALINAEFNNPHIKSATSNPYIVSYNVKVMSKTRLTDEQMAAFKADFEKITKTVRFKN